MKDWEEVIVDNDEIFNIVNEIKLLIKEDRYNNDSIKDLIKDNPNKIIKLEEALLREEVISIVIQCYNSTNLI